MFKKNSLDLWREEIKNSSSIITLSRKFDSALGGGLPCSTISAIAGASGCGKSLFCFLMCVNVQIPKELGGIGGKAIFIDTNQGFSLKRITEIATAVVDRCKSIAKNLKNKQISCPSVENILNNIFYNYVKDHIQLVAVVENLKQFLKDNKMVKIIVIDSFSFLFRSYSDTIVRTRILYEILTDLQSLAEQYNLAVLITNELTTRFHGKDTFVCPSLGDSHSHKVGQHIIFGKNNDDNSYIAYFDKMLLTPSCSIPFQITNSGIIGLKFS